VTANGPNASWTGFWYTYSTIRWRYAYSATTDAFTWTLPVTDAKAYHVYARWNKYWQGPTDATYTIYHANGSTTVVGNQQPYGGPDWHFLATVTLAPGQNHRVELSAQSNGSVAADAPSSAATWQPPVTTAGDYGLYLKWPYYNQLDPAANYTIVHGEGTSQLQVDQTAISGPTPWISLGVVPWAPNEDHRVELEGSFDYVTGADAIAVSDTPISATWTPDLPVTDTYNV
jgi:hypothetical protein